MVLLNMVAGLGFTEYLEIYFLDTGLLFLETHELVLEAERRYGIKVAAYVPDQTVDEQAARYGDELWRRNPDLCCSLRKVEPNFAALDGKRCWITGVGRDQSKVTSGAEVVSWKPGFGIVKVNPLATWSESKIWEYIDRNDVPYNRGHDEGYPSLGCTVCTRRVEPGNEDLRAGRWPGFAKTECGLHVNG